MPRAAPEIDRPSVPSTRASPAPPPAALIASTIAAPGAGPVAVRSRIDPSTGLREDVLMRGEFAMLEAPALRVTLTRGSAAVAAPTLFVLLARRAAAGPAIDRPALSVLRTGVRGQIVTKFGAVETLDVSVGGQVQRTCAGFVTRDAAVRLDGWYCAPLGRPPESEALRCAIDGLSFVDRTDADTTASFAMASASATACPSGASGREPPIRTGSRGQRSRNKK
jgi:hypothetical protein